MRSNCMMSGLIAAQEGAELMKALEIRTKPSGSSRVEAITLRQAGLFERCANTHTPQCLQRILLTVFPLSA